MEEKGRIDLDLPPKIDGEAIRSREEERVYFLDLLIVLAKHKKFIAWFVFAAVAASVSISLLLSPSFTASTRILPPQQDQSTASALLSQLNPLMNLAGTSGLGRNTSDLFLAMLRSRTVADNLIRQFSLTRVYRLKRDTDARTRLETLTEFNAGKEGVITISVTDRDPKRAADLANGYVEELKRLTNTLAVTEAGRRRLFFEREMENAKNDLVKADQALKLTQERTGILQLDSQAKVMLEAVATLRAQVAAKQVQVEAMRSYATPQNPDLVRAQNELAALLAQLAHFQSGQGETLPTDLSVRKMPGAGIEYVGKLREVKYRETLLELMTKQYEAARIDEAKDASLVQVLDVAVPPEKRSAPQHTAIVAATTFISVLVAFLFSFVFEAVEGAKKDVQLSTRWELLKSFLSKSHKT
jgi:tyrosine-protein kinase Etk/Wzc